MARDVKRIRVTEDLVFSLIVENHWAFDGNLEEAARYPEDVYAYKGYCKKDKLLLSIRACELIMDALEEELGEVLEEELDNLINGEVK